MKNNNTVHKETNNEILRKSNVLNTWGGPDAEVSCKVCFESIKNRIHVSLHFIQIDDVLHQGRINIHFGDLAFCLS